jgi:hypothetical protein
MVPSFPEEADPFDTNILLGEEKMLLPKKSTHKDVIMRCLRTATLKQPDHNDVCM